MRRRYINLLSWAILALGVGGLSTASALAAPRPSIQSLALEPDQPRVATIRVCALKGVLRISFREQLISSGTPRVVLGEASDFVIRRQAKRCQRHRLTWEEFEEVQGVGLHRIELRVTDQSGRISKPRKYVYKVSH